MGTTLNLGTKFEGSSVSSVSMNHFGRPALRIKCILGFAAPILAIFILASIANAQVTYTYTGNPFNVLGGTYTCPPICRISGSFTVSVPLGPNSTSAPSPTSFTFTDGGNIVTQSNATASVFFTITDSQGNIVAWNNEYANSQTSMFSGTNPPGCIGCSVLDGTFAAGCNQQQCTGWGEIADDPGTWVCSPACPAVTITSADLVNNSIAVTLTDPTGSSSGKLTLTVNGQNNQFTATANNGNPLGVGQYSVQLNRPSMPPDMYSSIQALWSTGSIGATTTFKVSPSWNVRGIVENTVYLKVYEDACSGTAATGYWTFDQSSCTFTAVNMKPKFASQTWINGSGETSEGALVHANTQNTCKRQYPKGATKKNTFYTISGVTGSCNNPMQDGDVAVSPNPVGGGQYSCNDPLVYVDLKTDDNALYPQIVEDWCPICTKRKAGTNDHVDNYVDNDSCTAKSWPNYWEADLGQGAEELRVSVGNQFAAQTGAATVTKSAKFLKYEDGDVKVTAKNVNDKIVLALDTSTLHKDIELPSEASEVNAIRRYRNQLAVITRMGGLASRVFIIDVTQGAVTDTFDGFDPVVSPDGRLIAFVKFYPPHFVQGPDDHYMLYDVNKTAVKNRPMGVPLDDSIDVGVNVYPGAGNKEDDNVGVPGKLQHHSASPFFWSADSAKLVFADQGQVLSIVMVKINESDAGEPATLVSALNGTSVCAAPLSVNSHCEAYMDNVEFVDQSIKSYFSGLGTKGSIQRELLVAEKDFRSNRK